jgi:PleD family two-component response regulator
MLQILGAAWGVTTPMAGERQQVMAKGRRRILVIGRSSSILEGVADLLQLTGYQVDMSSNWTSTEDAARAIAPNLVIVDLSDTTSDAIRLSEQIRKNPQWSHIPFLFVSFSGDDRIRELRKHGLQGDNGHLHYYAHTLLSMDGLLEEVQACLH